MLRSGFDENKKTVDKAVYLEESGEKEDEKSDSICGDDDDAFVGDAAGVCGERVCV